MAFEEQEQPMAESVEKTGKPPRRRVMGLVRRVGAAYVWSIAGDWREVRENAGRLRERFRALRSRRYRNEDFSTAVARLGLSKERLRRRHGQLYGLSVLYALIMAIALAFVCAAPFSEHPFNHALMSIGVAIVAGSKFLAARFRAAQIRAGRLFGFKEWLFGTGEGR